MILVVLAFIALLGAVYFTFAKLKAPGLKQREDENLEEFEHRVRLAEHQRDRNPVSSIIQDHAGKLASACVALSFMFVASTSFKYIDAGSVGHLDKIYGGNALTEGRIIAKDGEKGYQAKILRPGLNIEPLLNVIYNVTVKPEVTIPAGFYGLITTKDGSPLPDGKIMASPWEDSEFQNMLDADYFLRNKGQKGLQTSVLKPGTYPLNLYLYEVKIGNGKAETVCNAESGDYCQAYPNERHSKGSYVDTAQTVIPDGRVGVVNSKIQTSNSKACVAKATKVTDKEGNAIDGALSVPLVDIGCRGIWRDALKPGGYFLNREAYDVKLVDTRVKAWQYKGGYTKRMIDLKLAQDGSLESTPRSEVEVFDPKLHADRAIFVKVEGWDIPQEVRVVVQVAPENAPIVVASVGGLNEIEDRILTPAIRSITRNVIGGTITYSKNGKSETRATRVMDLIENRDILEENIESLVKTEGRKAGVDIKEVRFGEPAIPPELLVARQREQLSQQLVAAFKEEKKAQDERVTTEAARATANQQSELVTQQIANKRAELKKQELKDLGEGEKFRLQEIAQGEEARSLVLGKDRVMMLNITTQILDTLAKQPELVGLVGKLVPDTLVLGSGEGGLEGPAAILKKAFGSAPMPPK